MSKVSDYQQEILDAIEHIKPGRISWIGTKLDGEKYIVMELPVRLRDTVLTAMRAQLAPVSEDVQEAINDWGKIVNECEFARYHSQTILAALRAQIEPGWIKVSDCNKPDNGKVGLIRLVNAKYPIIGYYSKTYGCITSLSGGQYPLLLATHFHELPEPPKDGEK